MPIMPDVMPDVWKYRKCPPCPPCPPSGGGGGIVPAPAPASQPPTMWTPQHQVRGLGLFEDFDKNVWIIVGIALLAVFVLSGGFGLFAGARRRRRTRARQTAQAGPPSLAELWERSGGRVRVTGVTPQVALADVEEILP
jgi:hypothetical protein